MKKTALVAAFIICFFNIAKAQTDYCKDIIKEDDKTRSYIGYMSPVSFLQIGTNVLNDGSGKTIDIYMETTKKTANYEAYGIYAFFTDGTIWKDEGNHIDCSYFNAEFGYQYTAAKLLHEDDMILFKTKKIVKVKIANVEIPVTDEYATKFMAYVNCIDAIKK